MSDTSETIQERLLSNISDDYDKSKGSFFSDIAKTHAIEFAEQNKASEGILDKAFIDTSYGNYLDRKVIEQGLIRKQATQATGDVIITGQEGAEIKAGDKVASDTVTYTIKEDKIIDSRRNIAVKVESDEFGSKGNCPVGAIKYFPITISGVVAVTNTEKIDNGYESETDDELRSRYIDKVRTPPTSGNKYHYLTSAKEVIGVGDAKVFPLWNGNGTVKVVIVNSNKRGANTELINTVSMHIEDNRPIGATVTVASAVEKAINISSTFIIDTNNYTLEQVKTNIQSNVAKYLADIAFTETSISYAKIGSLIIASNGILDYSDLTINGGTANISIGAEEVAVIGTITNV